MKKTVKVTLHAQACSYADEGFTFSALSYDDMSSQGYIACSSVEVEFDVPPRDVLVNGAVAAYRAEQQRIRAEATSKVGRIDEAIQKLLCLEYKPPLLEDASEEFTGPTQAMRAKFDEEAG